MMGSVYTKEWNIVRILEKMIITSMIFLSNNVSKSIKLGVTKTLLFRKGGATDMGNGQGFFLSVSVCVCVGGGGGKGEVTG